jgi:hypothetical protein
MTGYSRSALIEELISSKSDERGWPRKCLGHMVVGNVLWTVWEITDLDGDKDRCIFCYVLMRHPDDWGVQSTGRTLGHLARHLPTSVFKDDAAAGNSLAKTRVFEYWEARKAARRNRSRA